MTRSLSEQIAFVFKALDELGVRAKANSRLDQLSRVFRANDGSWTRFVPIAETARFELALEALREFQLFEFILAPWEFGSDSVALEKLRTAVFKDHPLQYAQARGNTRGRGTQLELYVATAFRRSGTHTELLKPLGREPSPDIRTRACGRFYFVEAKRAKTFASIVGSIEEATHQVGATGCPGAAFIDVTMAFNEENRAANEHLAPERVQPTIRDWLQSRFEPLKPEVDRRMRGTRLTSIYFQQHLLIPVRGQLQLRSTLLTYPERVEGKYAREDAEIRRSLDHGWMHA